ncbi:MAG: cobalt ECF transporter T component CbiQ [Lachnospiraceae bacterium]|nr:cobalt ECF transporter T component CbiQ [Lachnospiraceae bacterium]
MSKFNQAIYEIQNLDTISKEDKWVNHIHPLIKLFLTVYYIGLVVSFQKYDLEGLCGMCIYPIFVFIIGELSWKEAIYRLRIVLPLVCIVGILNPFFDTNSIAEIGGIAISGGVVSMVTLMIKGIFCILAGYLLIATTSIEEICYGLRKIHIPKIMVTQILLIYRYIFLLLWETKRITQAYALRAPGQKGIHIKAWGPLVGQLLLRSMDRAQEVYESMCIRGFQGEFFIRKRNEKVKGEFIYFIAFLIILLICRIYPIFEVIGGFFL